MKNKKIMSKIESENERENKNRNENATYKKYEMPAVHTVDMHFRSFRKLVQRNIYCFDLVTYYFRLQRIMVLMIEYSILSPIASQVRTNNIDKYVTYIFYLRTV